MPTIYVDDTPLEFTQGETILPAVLRAGADIPHYCYHPGLAITAQCRQCLVEITDAGNGRGIPKLQTSCSTPAVDGMRVLTNSAKAVAGQKLINEFILINHPLDCPICDQAGECDLQDIAHRYGTGHSEMEYEKRTYGWRDVGTFIALERNRCIHCSRCERFSRDLVGSHDFAAFLRTSELTFDTFNDSQMSHLFQGNLADICPVGCITVKDWRFKKRAWKFVKTPSVCASCSTGCNTTIEHHQNRAFRVKPRENQALNRWWMCDVGRIAQRAWNRSKDRAVEPLLKADGTQHASTWSDTLQTLTRRIKEIGVEDAQVVGLCDTRATVEEMYSLQRLLKQCFESEEVWRPDTSDSAKIKPPRNTADAFLYDLVRTDATPNTQGAELLGIHSAGANAARLKSVFAKNPPIVFILGAAFGEDEALVKAVRNAKLVVWIGVETNAWSAMADAVLPSLNHAEKFGTYVNRQGRIQRIQPALRAVQQARCATNSLSTLGEHLGGGKAFDSAKQALEELGRAEGSFKGLNWEAVGALGTMLRVAKAKQGAA